MTLPADSSPALLRAFAAHTAWVALHTEAPGISPEGLRAKVGAVHIPLGELVQAFLNAGFQLERFEEVGERLYPPIIVLQACR